MSTELTWFVAEAIFHVWVHTEQGEIKTTSEDLLFLVQAIDHSSGVTQAEALARAKEESYDNQYGQRVSWRFVRLVGLTEMIDQRFEAGAELKSAMTTLAEAPTPPLKFCCEQMQRAVSDEAMPIVYEAKFREYGIRVLDGGTSFIELLYCPWSGHKLPASLRDQWFDELQRRGIDPIAGDVPAEFSDERWYT